MSVPPVEVVALCDDEADDRPLARTIIAADGSRRRLVRPRPGQRIDWSYAADLLAKGESVAAVAETMMCEPERIWRNLKRSRRFRARIALAHDRQALQTSLQFRSLGGRMVGQMAGHADRLDTKMLQWVANRLNLSQLTRGGQELTDRLEELAALPPASPLPPGRARAATADDFTRKFLAALRDGDAAAIRVLAKAELARREMLKAEAPPAETAGMPPVVAPAAAVPPEPAATRP